MRWLDGAAEPSDPFRTPLRSLPLPLPRRRATCWPPPVPTHRAFMCGMWPPGPAPPSRWGPARPGCWRRPPACLARPSACSTREQHAHRCASTASLCRPLARPLPGRPRGGEHAALVALRRLPAGGAPLGGLPHLADAGGPAARGPGQSPGAGRGWAGRPRCAGAVRRAACAGAMPWAPAWLQPTAQVAVPSALQGPDPPPHPADLVVAALGGGRGRRQRLRALRPGRGLLGARLALPAAGL